MNWLRIAGLIGFLGVGLGAFGAHGLRGRIAPNLLAAYQTGAQYHLIHASVLLALALYGRASSTPIGLSAGCFSAGILLFSGSLYLMAATGVTKLGMVTPIGGLAFLAGWISLLSLR